MNRKNYIENSFNQIFSEYKNSRIAIYGLGEYAGWLIKTFPDYNFVGLMDRWASSGVKYGKPILTYREVLGKDVNIIIIAAGKDNTEVIRKRITYFCSDNHIRLFSLEGEELTVENRQFFSLDRRIDLLMEHPDEVIKNFEVICFRIEDIFLQHRFSGKTIGEELRGKIQNLTVPEGYSHIFNVSRKSNKIIYFICDDANTPAILESVLHEYNIYGFKAIIPRSEAEELLTSIQKKFLVIGSNQESQLAIHNSKVEFVRAYSSTEIAYASRFCECMETAVGKTERLYRGMIISRAFSDSRQIDKMGRLHVSNPYDLGYIFLGPLVTDFMLWLMKRIHKSKYDSIIFSARDGYLFQILYEYIRKIGMYDDMPDSKYLLTSRYVGMLSNLATQEDILKCVEIIFEGDAELMLQKRFLLSREEIIPYSECGNMFVTEYILLHRAAILSKAARIREDYQKYLKQAGLLGSSIVFFDLVASGSCQSEVQKLLNIQFDGAYFMRMPTEDTQKQNLNIYSYHEFNHDFADHSMLMECILTSLKPTLLYLDQDMCPVYGPELRSTEEIEFVSRAQKGIYDFFVEFLSDYKDTEAEPVAGIFPDRLYGNISSHYTEIENETFAHYILKDEIFNQSNNLSNKCMV